MNLQERKIYTKNNTVKLIRNQLNNQIYKLHKKLINIFY